jgi:glycosyltransferase involved in cell wall biosynthesis
MKILFISLGKINSIDDNDIYPDLLREFNHSENQIFIVSSVEKREKRKTNFQNINNINYLKVKIGNITKTNVFEKGLSTILLEYRYYKSIKKYFKNVHFDLILYSTPPISFVKIIKKLKNKNTISYLLLKDIFPQNAVDLNLLSKKNPIYWFFRFKEKKLYEISDYIGCMSNANMNYILSHNDNLSNEKVHINPNSINPSTFRSDIVANSKYIKEKYNLPTDKVIMIFGGNLGRPQGLDFLLDCIIKTSQIDKFYYLIIGAGTEYSRIKKFFLDEKPTNALLLNHVEKNDYLKLEMACDIGLIFLNKRFTIPNYPSKILSYMHARKPVLAATDQSTDINDTIVNGNFGYWSQSGDVAAFIENMKKLSDPALRKSLGENGRKFLEQNFTSKISYDIIMNYLKK